MSEPKQSTYPIPESIHVVDDLTFKVEFDKGGEKVSYLFTIDTNVHGVGWEPEYLRSMNQDMDKARPLFISILNLFDARQALLGSQSD